MTGKELMRCSSAHELAITAPVYFWNLFEIETISCVLLQRYVIRL